MNNIFIILVVPCAVVAGMISFGLLIDDLIALAKWRNR